MENWHNVESAVQSALNSTGSAARENEKYLDSIQGRISQFTSATQQMWNNAISSDFIKFVVDLGTVIVKLVDSFGLWNTAILTVVTSLLLLSERFRAFYNANIASLFSSLAEVIQYKLVTSLGMAKSSAIALAGAFNMIAPLAIMTLIMGVIKGIQWLSQATERQMEKIRNLKEEYDSLNQLLEENKKKNQDAINKLEELYELRKNNKITKAEKEELERLEKVNEKLQKQIEYEETLQKIKGESLERETLKLSKEKTESKISFREETISQFNPGVEVILMTKDEKLKEEIQLVRYYTDEISKLEKEYEKGAISAENRKEKEDELIQTRATHIEKVDELIKQLKEEGENYRGFTEEGTERKKAIEELVESSQKLITSIDGGISVLNNGKNTLGDTFKVLIDSKTYFDDWSESISDTIKELKTLNQAIDDVSKGQSLSADTVTELILQYPELASAIKKTSNGWTIEKEVLENVRKAKVRLRIESINADIDMARQAVESALKRIKAYNIEIDAIKNLATAKKEADKLLGEMPDTLKRGNVPHYARVEWLKEYGYYSILELGKLVEQGKTLEELLSDPNFGVSSDKSKTKSSEKTPFSEQFDFIDTKIKLLNQELEELQQKLDDTFSPTDKQTIIDKMIEVQQKKADVLKQAIKTYETSAQKELQKIPKSLRSAVVSGSFNIATISEKTYGEKRAKEISEAIKQYQLLTDTIIGLKNEYAEIDNTIRSLDLDKITLSFEEFDDKIKESDQALEELDYQLNLLGENDFDRKAELIGKKIEVTTSQVNEYAEELEKLKAIVPANAEEAEKLKERIDELTKKFREGKVSIKEYKDTLEETAKSLVSTLLNTQKDIDKKNLDNQLKEREKQIYDITEAEFEAYKKAKIESLKKQKEENEKIATDEAKEMARLLGEKIKEEERINYADIVDFSEIYEDIHNQKIKQYQETIDVLERTNELEQQRLEREKKVLEIQQLQIELQNTLNNKNVQILRKKEDGTWDYDYVADPEKVEKLNKQIAEKQKDFNKWEKDNALKQMRNLLQQKIKQEQELIRTSNETYDKIATIETTKFNKHYENMDIIAQTALDVLKETYSNKWDEIIKVLQEKVSFAEREYAKLLGMADISMLNLNSSGGSSNAEQSIIEQMKANSKAWHLTGSSKKKKELEDKNYELGVSLGWTRKDDGVWYKPDGTKAYKDGGIVDYTGLALVHGTPEKPEGFLNHDDLSNLMKIVNITRQTIPKINSITPKVVNKKSTSTRQVFHISKLEFPNIKSADGLKEAILDLPRLSLQMAKEQ